jgi:hypothetical protein
VHGSPRACPVWPAASAMTPAQCVWPRRPGGWPRSGRWERTPGCSASWRSRRRDLVPGWACARVKKCGIRAGR